MKVEPLPPIPSPPAHLWRQFRVKALPLVTFVGVLGLTVWLWTLNQTNPLVMGTAQGFEAAVSSPTTGTLTELRVSRYQEVKQGDIIAVLHVTNPQVASNTLAVLRAEMEVARTEGSYDLGDRVRYAQFQLDWMIERADVVALKQQLIFAEAEHRRLEQLRKKEIVDQSIYDIARRDLEQAKESLAVKTAAVESAGATLNQLDPQRGVEDNPAVRASLDLLAAELRLLESEQQPVVLTSPIDGRVSKVSKLEGTTVLDGEPIVTVASPDVDYILGYIGQPIQVEPTLGMDVEVRSRGLNRAVAHARVTEVGPRIELFNAPLRVRGMGNAQQRGLPILVSIPPDMKLRPGELVDLRLLPAR